MDKSSADYTHQLALEIYEKDVTEELCDAARQCLADVRELLVEEVSKDQVQEMIANFLDNLSMTVSNVLGEWNRERTDVKSRLKLVRETAITLQEALKSLDIWDSLELYPHIDNIFSSVPVSQDDQDLGGLIENDNGSQSRYVEHVKGFSSLRHSIDVRLDTLISATNSAVSNLPNKKTVFDKGRFAVVRSLLWSVYELTDKVPKSGFTSSSSGAVNNKGRAISSFSRLVKLAVPTNLMKVPDNDEWINDEIRAFRKSVGEKSRLASE